MKKSNPITLEHIIAGAIILGLFSWFIVRAIYQEQIPMGGKGITIKSISRIDSPNEFWGSIIGLSFFTLLGWFAIGLNAYRLIKNK